jgi:hypothetical protein
MVQNAQCSDPRDRVFALRSIVRPEQQQCIQPDYTKDVQEIYHDFLVRTAERIELLDWLRRCQIPQPEQQNPSWPT